MRVGAFSHSSERKALAQAASGTMVQTDTPRPIGAEFRPDRVDHGSELLRDASIDSGFWEELANAASALEYPADEELLPDTLPALPDEYRPLSLAVSLNRADSPDPIFDRREHADNAVNKSANRAESLDRRSHSSGSTQSPLRAITPAATPEMSWAAGKRRSAARKARAAWPIAEVALSRAKAARITRVTELCEAEKALIRRLGVQYTNNDVQINSSVILSHPALRRYAIKPRYVSSYLYDRRAYNWYSEDGQRLASPRIFYLKDRLPATALDTITQDLIRKMHDADPTMSFSAIAAHPAFAGTVLTARAVERFLEPRGRMPKKLGKVRNSVKIRAIIFQTPIVVGNKSAKLTDQT